MESVLSVLDERVCYRTGLMSGSWTGWLMVIAGLISWDPALEGWSGRST